MVIQILARCPLMSANLLEMFYLNTLIDWRDGKEANVLHLQETDPDHFKHQKHLDKWSLNVETTVNSKHGKMLP